MLVYGVFRQDTNNSAQTLIALYSNKSKADNAKEVYQALHDDLLFKVSIIKVLDWWQNK